MKPNKGNTISILVFGIAIFSTMATLFGILSSGEIDVSQFTSIHGKKLVNMEKESITICP
jgi:hypothetical protein